MINYLWNDGAKYMGRVVMVVFAVKIALAAFGITTGDIDTWLASNGI